ncbi:VWA domain-containing protein [Amycolatopsis sp. GM8]|uniref:VWA domain-containing protein n=1 Tax=Amycolatopsis sp. GM8 TaxID=2896530 RepID=UPI001F30FE13|nr:VWA domain-containing protein [Amycolatopsis sp. GM8]
MALQGFTTPAWFGLLAVVAALAVGYRLAQRARRRRVLRFANLALLDRVTSPETRSWARHLPAIFSLLALTIFVIALAGPTADAQVPRDRGTVVLVIDDWLSMAAADVKPSRLAAVETAASDFTRGLPPGIDLGLVTFAGTATVDVQPTTQRAPVLQAVQRIKLADSTATGEALTAACNAAQEINQLMAGPNGPPPTRIVLLSDGAQNTGRDSGGPALDCKNAGIGIDTISVGTTGPEATVTIDGHPVAVPAEPQTMQQIAALSGGHWYNAPDTDTLHQIYTTLGHQIGYETQRTDASKPWFVLGTIMSIAGLAAALTLYQRIP